jgi:hypothetical protein
VKQEETVQTRLPDGGMTIEQREQQIVPGSTTNELRSTKMTTETSRPLAAGQQQTQMRIEVWDGNQGLRPIWVVDSKGSRRE